MKHVLFLLALTITTGLFAQFQGPNNPSSAADPVYMCNPDCGTPWISPANVYTSNGQYAGTYLDNFPFTSNDTCYFSRYISAENFGFTIPGNATITGIFVEVEGATGVGSTAMDSSAFLSKDGVNRTGANRASNSWGNIFFYMPYGSTTDLWGTTWTPAEINASTFGFRLRLMNPSASLMPSNIAIDHIRITVYYTLPTGSFSQSSSPDGFFLSYDRTNGHFNLFSNNPIDAPLEISLFDMGGKQVFHEKLTPGAGQTRFVLGRQRPLPGIYLAEIIAHDRTFFQKCIVIE